MYIHRHIYSYINFLTPSYETMPIRKPVPKHGNTFQHQRVK